MWLPSDPTALLYWLCGLSVASWVWARLFYSDFRRIKGIPEVPGASLLYGHLKLLGNDHASTLQRWSTEYGWPIFQIRLGYRRVLVLNGFGVTKEWMVTNQASTIDRPQFYTFHGVVSKTSAATIGTNPWNESTKKQRRVVNSLTSPPAMRKLRAMFDLETADMVRGVLARGDGGSVAISPHIFQKKLALNVVMMFCYGRRFEDVEDPVLLQILADVSVISTFRSTNANVQDHVPPLRYLAFLTRARSRVAAEVRSRRDAWLAALLREVQSGLAAGENRDCVAARLLSDKEEQLTTYDIRTILGGLMSGGFETIISSAVAGIAYLASPEGQRVQRRAREDILASYGSAAAAFEGCVDGGGGDDRSSRYTAALVRETLRCYPPLHLLPPRQTYRPFAWGGGPDVPGAAAAVPAGVMVLVNAQAANADPAAYGPDAHVFRPERWLEEKEEEEKEEEEHGSREKKGRVPPPPPPPYHFSFGAGSRGCTAVAFSNRLLYAIFVRLLVSFEIRQSDEAPPDTHRVRYNPDTTAQTAIPRDFKAYFRVRDRGTLGACLERSHV